MWKEQPDRHRRAVRSPVEETALVAPASATHRAGTLASPNITLFRCVNCSRPRTTPASADGRTSQPEPRGPVPVHEIALPCVGKLQPEQLLKAFEAGADAVCVMTCAADNCRYLEGSQRAERRVEYVRKLLDEIGLGGERLIVLHAAAPALPTSGNGTDPQPHGRVPDSQTAVPEMMMAGLGALRPSPLRRREAAG